jgi:hypothetical protein
MRTVSTDFASIDVHAVRRSPTQLVDGILIVRLRGGDPMSDIDVEYAQLGRASGFPGIPITAEPTTPDGIGRNRRFQGGSIHRTPGTGAPSSTFRRLGRLAEQIAQVARIKRGLP